MNKFVYVTQNIMKSNNVIVKEKEIGILIKQDTHFSFVQFVNQPNILRIPSNYIRLFNPEKTGDQHDQKVCNRCNRLLPINEFQKNQNGKNNRTVRRPSCVDCRELIDGKSVSAKTKAIWDLKKPHMQIWECPICKKRTIPGLTSKVVLDHNHQTGEPRAWICDSCNTGLGRFKDDINVMESAIEYLKNK